LTPENKREKGKNPLVAIFGLEHKALTNVDDFHNVCESVRGIPGLHQRHQAILPIADRVGRGELAWCQPSFLVFEFFRSANE
jgi:hypothetical protein